MKCAFFENRECNNECKAFYVDPRFKDNEKGNCARLIIELPTDKPTLIL